ncbi:hypothetical protein [Luteipulveratus halotolerans]|uniref:ATP/GTP-binding protein n=1 Tax=Luteipulveratus halotolerans TaxID=1631356 RepID=A0A0L6CPK2_9MICO|nr:hypothetical protein [Luteipulveratus halotolerans]KNX39701.1 hypothetical protein VV01_00245 [Luteipulveratus halotolerans]
MTQQLERTVRDVAASAEGQRSAQRVRDRARGVGVTHPAGRKKGRFRALARLRSQLAKAGHRGPTMRGWTGPGGGRAGWLEAPTEWVTTSKQAPGLWPWVIGQAPPPIGTPVGTHMEHGYTVCADPIAWFVAGLINAPTAFVLGRMGLGKSSLIRHIMAFVGDYGVLPIVMSDTRPEYGGVIKAMGGVVIELGPGQKHMNVLDPGPAADYLSALAERGEDDLVTELLALIRSQRLNALKGLLEIATKEAISSRQSNILAKALDVLDEDFDGVPVLGDMRALIESRDERLRTVVGDRGSDDRYDERVEELLSALGTIDVGGIFGDTFGRQTDERPPLDAPFCFDVSRIDQNDTALMGCVQFLSWTQAVQVLAASKYLADAGVLPKRRYLMIGDELYRALRALPLIVHRVDNLIRMIRALGSGLLLCTHTMNDLNLDGPDGPLTKIAWGFVERSDMCFMGGLSRNEMGNLKTVWDMSDKEQDDVTGWSDMGSVNPDTGAREEPPGRAKFLLKLGRSPGIPFRGVIADIEKEVIDTNSDWESLRDQLLGRKEAA